jgi:2,3-bisphosphoglycerate-independent phosphoglycerate mutase
VRTAHVAHTLNPVPFIVCDYSGANAWALSEVANPGLSSIAGTLLNLLGYGVPGDYDGSLVKLG